MTPMKKKRLMVMLRQAIEKLNDESESEDHKASFDEIITILWEVHYSIEDEESE